MTADKLSLGPLELTDVLIEEAEADRIFPRSVPDYAATFGLEALKRLDFIVDGKQGMAYLRPKEPPSAPGEHNRLGAVFVPSDDQSDDLVAHVLEGSPAFEAGIRNGDVLLKIGKRDVSNWRTDPGLVPNRPASYSRGASAHTECYFLSAAATYFRNERRGTPKGVCESWLSGLVLRIGPAPH